MLNVHFLKVKSTSLSFAVDVKSSVLNGHLCSHTFHEINIHW